MVSSEYWDSFWPLSSFLFLLFLISRLLHSPSHTAAGESRGYRGENAALLRLLSQPEQRVLWPCKACRFASASVCVYVNIWLVCKPELGVASRWELNPTCSLMVALWWSGGEMGMYIWQPHIYIHSSIYFSILGLFVPLCINHIKIMTFCHQNPSQCLCDSLHVLHVCKQCMRLLKTFSKRSHFTVWNRSTEVKPSHLTFSFFYARERLKRSQERRRSLLQPKITESTKALY